MDTQLFFLLNSFAGQNPALDFFIVFLAKYLAYILIALLFVWLVFSEYLRKDKIVIGSSALISGWISRYGFGTPLRYLWHRPRPLDALHVHQLLVEHSYSFPSGHATFLFGLSSLLYLYNKKIGIVSFVATLLITVARVAAGVHYPSDIFAGMIFGMISAWITFRYVAPLLKRHMVYKIQWL